MVRRAASVRASTRPEIDGASTRPEINDAARVSASLFFDWRPGGIQPMGLGDGVISRPAGDDEERQ
jgi:hypothetical protein